MLFSFVRNDLFYHFLYLFQLTLMFYHNFDIFYFRFPFYNLYNIICILNNIYIVMLYVVEYHIQLLNCPIYGLLFIPFYYNIRINFMFSFKFDSSWIKNFHYIFTQYYLILTLRIILSKQKFFQQIIIISITWWIASLFLFS